MIASSKHPYEIKVGETINFYEPRTRIVLSGLVKSQAFYDNESGRWELLIEFRDDKNLTNLRSGEYFLNLERIEKNGKIVWGLFGDI